MTTRRRFETSCCGLLVFCSLAFAGESFQSPLRKRQDVAQHVCQLFGHASPSCESVRKELELASRGAGHGYDGVESRRDKQMMSMRAEIERLMEVTHAGDIGEIQARHSKEMNRMQGEVDRLTALTNDDSSRMASMQDEIDRLNSWKKMDSKSQIANMQRALHGALLSPEGPQGASHQHLGDSLLAAGLPSELTATISELVVDAVQDQCANATKWELQQNQSNALQPKITDLETKVPLQKIDDATMQTCPAGFRRCLDGVNSVFGKWLDGTPIQDDYDKKRDVNPVENGPQGYSTTSLVDEKRLYMQCLDAPESNACASKVKSEETSTQGLRTCCYSIDLLSGSWQITMANFAPNSEKGVVHLTRSAHHMCIRGWNKKLAKHLSNNLRKKCNIQSGRDGGTTLPSTKTNICPSVHCQRLMLQSSAKAKRCWRGHTPLLGPRFPAYAHARVSLPSVHRDFTCNTAFQDQEYVQVLVLMGNKLMMT